MEEAVALGAGSLIVAGVTAALEAVLDFQCDAHAQLIHESHVELEEELHAFFHQLFCLLLIVSGIEFMQGLVLDLDYAQGGIVSLVAH